jgi:CRP-like cAMP-binding protein
MTAPIALLRRVELFADAEEADLVELAALAQERFAGRGAPVITAGSRASGFFIISEGHATVRVHGEVQQRLGPGDCFGELALIDEGRRAADVTADCDMHYYGLSQSAFRTFVRARPDVMWLLLEHTVRLLRDSQRHRPPRAGRARSRLRRRPRHAT